jgi:hypothetical protein
MIMKNAFYFSFCFIFTGSVASAQLLQNNIQYWRPNEQQGINVFETGKEDTVSFEGIRLRLGGNFTQQYQALEHSNSSVSVLNANGVNLNGLMDIGPGFNLATANLNLDVQLADGIRLNLVTYLSSRHHPETWVKGGYLQFDKLSFLNSGFNEWYSKHMTIKAGHMEINYGDAHFRRTDNGNAMYNPFVGNYIMDAFTTEIGGEVYVRQKEFFLIFAMTNGEIKGEVTNPSKRSPSFYAKIGYDKQLNDDLRIRLTGSGYTTDKSISNTLYGGDRAGSRYYFVMENTLASVSSNFTSGSFNPGFRYNVTSFVINPFIKFRWIELFGMYETSTGKSSTENADRNVQQIAADLIFRFGTNEKFYLAGRYNEVTGEASGIVNSISIKRYQAGAGWFITKNILAKVEYVDQRYTGYPEDHILYMGKFSGIMLEGVIAF